MKREIVQFSALSTVVIDNRKNCNIIFQPRREEKTNKSKNKDKNKTDWEGGREDKINKTYREGWKGRGKSKKERKKI